MSWVLTIGIHRGTLTSRDSHAVKTTFDSGEELRSLEDCIDTAKKWQQNYGFMGYSLWYATAIDPEGVKYLNITPGTPYY